MRLLSHFSRYSWLLGALLLLSACGGSDDSVLLTGKIEGCEFEQYATSNILVAVFGRGPSNTLVEVATTDAYINPTASVHTYAIVLGGKPAANIIKSGGDVKYAELFIQGYVDKNKNYVYDTGDRLLEPAAVQLAYFFANENSTNAKKGYNYKSGTGLYLQDFSKIPIEESIVTAFCENSR